MYGDMTYLEKNFNIFTNLTRSTRSSKRYSCCDELPKQRNKQDWQKVELEKLEVQMWLCLDLARGRDYHKVLKKILKIFADKISSITGKFGHRALCRLSSNF